jgi:HPr kinase/phosphorylase
VPGPPVNLHATAIAVDGRGVLIRGPSGAGKSDLALRCLTLGPRPLLPDHVELIADDRVLVRGDSNGVLVWGPDNLRGRLEVRGVGILAFPCRLDARLALVVDLVARGEIERLPDSATTVVIEGHVIPHLSLHAFDHSAPIKLLLAAADPERIGAG